MRISKSRMAEWSTSASGRLSELIPARQYCQLNEPDEILRLWLPEAVKTAIDEVADRSETSMTVYLTEFFVTHLYGRHELLRMRESKSGLYEPLLRKYCAMSAGEPAKPPSLGKNIFPIKIFIPVQIKEDLKRIADRFGLTLGEYGRQIISAHMFGYDYSPELYKLLSENDQRSANQWENIEVANEEYEF